ncbi:MAG: NADH-quinone oxidoreductase subunit J [Bacteroidetes bacterium]|nr:MAG: NADH-quinone oxidoreductase subunit J [Bacteroidota bacterium]REK06670.1 MAG: NADH-quinone oxidoreductase subunit J [Bacteroidota bacterium]REK33436.1 MAG: NADH-quinone oxidoreductase subunit J [Bacteroidota bacterium]REK47118.1 MAG: NADH-quinone oxidoreductase subunit J [Bacteroidota bacterium]
MESIVFYMLAFLVLSGGIMAVTARKIFRSAIYLLFSLVGIAGLYFLLAYEFLAAVQVVVYVGGIVVLIIFSIFLTQAADSDLPKALRGRKVFSFLATAAGFALVLTQILRHNFIPSGSEPVSTNVTEIGLRMLSTGEGGYALPFEVVSVLLLAAMIGCIVIAIKKPGNS